MSIQENFIIFGEYQEQTQEIDAPQLSYQQGLINTT